MSTKIFNGYVADGTDLPDVIDAFHAKREAVTEAGRDLIAGFYARKAAAKIDRAHFDSVACEGPLLGAMSDLLDRQSKVRASGVRDPEVDTETSVVLLPIPGKVLVMVFTEQDDIRDILTSGLTPYPYWNNSDRPEEIDEAAWEQRRQDWEAALSRDSLSRPAACGIVLEYLPYPETPSIERILRVVPAGTTRAKEVVVREILRTVGDAEGVFPYREVMTRVRRENWGAEREARYAEVLSALPAITRETLLNGLPGPA